MIDSTRLQAKVLSPAAEAFRYFIIEQGELEGLEDAYLQYNGLFGSGVDVIVGQFQVSDPLFKRELRLERADYDIYKVHVGDSQTNLTYDRGATRASMTDPASATRPRRAVTMPGNCHLIIER